MVRSVLASRENSPMTVVNCVKWMPGSGQGFVLGTNQGNVIVYHSICVGRVNLNMDSSDVPAASRALFVV